VPSNLYVSPERAAALRADSRAWPSIDLTPRQLCDLELILNGAFAPLRGFMTKGEYTSVVEQARLPDDSIWPTPVTLDLAPAGAQQFHESDRIALRDREGVMLAALTVAEVWSDGAGRRHLGGAVEGIQPPAHPDFDRFRRTPAQVHQELTKSGWSRAAAFHALYPAPPDVLAPVFDQARALDMPLLLQLVTGATGPDDPAYFERVRGFDEAIRAAASVRALFMILPLPIEATGARAVVLRALVARNFGCTHLLSSGEIPEQSRKLAWEIGIELVPLPEQPSAVALAARDRTAEGHRAPRGVTVFFTGLSGSGKSTIANALLVKLMEAGNRTVSLLDGDAVRKHLSSELGFSKEHRDLNIRRIGYVASEITKHGGVAICAPIAPYQEVRRDVRHMVEAYGGFVLVYVSTPLEVCEQRDRKGLYAKARAGQIQHFTGISDPFEPPADAALVIDASLTSADEAAGQILTFLRRQGYV
jgi:sulfate adenylyltransferase